VTINLSFLKKSKLKYCFKFKSNNYNFPWIKIYFLNQEIQNQMYNNQMFSRTYSLNLIFEKIIKSSLLGELNLVYLFLNELELNREKSKIDHFIKKKKILCKKKNNILSIILNKTLSKYCLFYFFNKKKKKLNFVFVNLLRKFINQSITRSQKLKKFRQRLIVTQLFTKRVNFFLGKGQSPLSKKRLNNNKNSKIFKEKSYFSNETNQMYKLYLKKIPSNLKSDFLVKNLFYKNWFFNFLQSALKSQIHFTQNNISFKLVNDIEFYDKKHPELYSNNCSLLLNIKIILIYIYLEPKFVGHFKISLKRKNLNLLSTLFNKSYIFSDINKIFYKLNLVLPKTKQLLINPINRVLKPQNSIYKSNGYLNPNKVWVKSKQLLNTNYFNFFSPSIAKLCEQLFSCKRSPATPPYAGVIQGSPSLVCRSHTKLPLNLLLQEKEIRWGNKRYAGVTELEFCLHSSAMLGLVAHPCMTKVMQGCAKISFDHELNFKKLSSKNLLLKTNTNIVDSINVEKSPLNNKIIYSFFIQPYFINKKESISYLRNFLIFKINNLNFKQTNLFVPIKIIKNKIIKKNYLVKITNFYNLNFQEQFNNINDGIILKRFRFFLDISNRKITTKKNVLPVLSLAKDYLPNFRILLLRQVFVILISCKKITEGFVIQYNRVMQPSFSLARTDEGALFWKFWLPNKVWIASIASLYSLVAQLCNPFPFISSCKRIPGGFVIQPPAFLLKEEMKGKGVPKLCKIWTRISCCQLSWQIKMGEVARVDPSTVELCRPQLNFISIFIKYNFHHYHSYLMFDFVIQVYRDILFYLTKLLLNKIEIDTFLVKNEFIKNYNKNVDKVIFTNNQLLITQNFGINSLKKCNCKQCKINRKIQNLAQVNSTFLNYSLNKFLQKKIFFIIYNNWLHLFTIEKFSIKKKYLSTEEMRRNEISKPFLGISYVARNFEKLKRIWLDQFICPSLPLLRSKGIFFQLKWIQSKFSLEKHFMLNFILGKRIDFLNRYKFQIKSKINKYFSSNILELKKKDSQFIKKIEIPFLNRVFLFKNHSNKDLKRLQNLPIFCLINSFCNSFVYNNVKKKITQDTINPIKIVSLKFLTKFYLDYVTKIEFLKNKNTYKIYKGLENYRNVREFYYHIFFESIEYNNAQILVGKKKLNKLTKPKIGFNLMNYYYNVFPFIIKKSNHFKIKQMSTTALYFYSSFLNIFYKLNFLSSNPSPPATSPSFSLARDGGSSWGRGVTADLLKNYFLIENIILKTYNIFKNYLLSKITFNLVQKIGQHFLNSKILKNIIYSNSLSDSNVDSEKDIFNVPLSKEFLLSTLKGSYAINIGYFKSKLIIDNLNTLNNNEKKKRFFNFYLINQCYILAKKKLFFSSDIRYSDISNFLKLKKQYFINLNKNLIILVLYNKKLFELKNRMLQKLRKVKKLKKNYSNPSKRIARVNKVKLKIFLKNKWYLFYNLKSNVSKQSLGLQIDILNLISHCQKVIINSSSIPLLCLSKYSSLKIKQNFKDNYSKIFIQTNFFNLVSLYLTNDLYIEINSNLSKFSYSFFNGYHNCIFSLYQNFLRIFCKKNSFNLHSNKISENFTLYKNINHSLSKCPLILITSNFLFKLFNLCPLQNQTSSPSITELCKLYPNFVLVFTPCIAELCQQLGQAALRPPLHQVSLNFLDDKALVTPSELPQLFHPCRFTPSELPQLFHPFLSISLARDEDYKAQFYLNKVKDYKALPKLPVLAQLCYASTSSTVLLSKTVQDLVALLQRFSCNGRESLKKGYPIFSLARETEEMGEVAGVTFYNCRIEGWGKSESEELGLVAGVTLYNCMIQGWGKKLGLVAGDLLQERRCLLHSKAMQGYPNFVLLTQTLFGASRTALHDESHTRLCKIKDYKAQSLTQQEIRWTLVLGLIRIRRAEATNPSSSDSDFPQSCIIQLYKQNSSFSLAMHSEAMQRSLLLLQEIRWGTRVLDYKALNKVKITLPQPCIMQLYHAGLPKLRLGYQTQGFVILTSNQVRSYRLQSLIVWACTPSFPPAQGFVILTSNPVRSYRLQSLRADGKEGLKVTLTLFTRDTLGLQSWGRSEGDLLKRHQRCGGLVDGVKRGFCLTKTLFGNFSSIRVALNSFAIMGRYTGAMLGIQARVDEARQTFFGFFNQNLKKLELRVGDIGYFNLVITGNKKFKFTVIAKVSFVVTKLLTLHDEVIQVVLSQAKDWKNSYYSVSGKFLQNNFCSTNLQLKLSSNWHLKLWFLVKFFLNSLSFIIFELEKILYQSLIKNFFQKVTKYSIFSRFLKQTPSDFPSKRKRKSGGTQKGFKLKFFLKKERLKLEKLKSLNLLDYFLQNQKIIKILKLNFKYLIKEDISQTLKLFLIFNSNFTELIRLFHLLEGQLLSLRYSYAEVYQPQLGQAASSLLLGQIYLNSQDYKALVTPYELPQLWHPFLSISLARDEDYKTLLLRTPAFILQEIGELAGLTLSNCMIQGWGKKLEASCAALYDESHTRMCQIKGYKAQPASNLLRISFSCWRISCQRKPSCCSSHKREEMRQQEMSGGIKRSGRAGDLLKRRRRDGLHSSAMQGCVTSRSIASLCNLEDFIFNYSLQICNFKNLNKNKINYFYHYFFRKFTLYIKFKQVYLNKALNYNSLILLNKFFNNFFNLVLKIKVIKFKHSLNKFYIYYGKNLLFFHYNSSFLKKYLNSFINLLCFYNLTINKKKLFHSIFPLKKYFSGFIFYGFYIFQKVTVNKFFKHKQLLKKNKYFITYLICLANQEFLSNKLDILKFKGIINLKNKLSFEKHLKVGINSLILKSKLKKKIHFNLTNNSNRKKILNFFIHKNFYLLKNCKVKLVNYKKFSSFIKQDNFLLKYQTLMNNKNIIILNSFNFNNKLDEFPYKSFSSIIILSYLSNLILPSDKNIKNHLNQIKTIVSKSQGESHEFLIKKLAPLINKWCNYYKIISKKRFFNKCDFLLMKILWKWCSKRHNFNSNSWIKEKYFYSINNKKSLFAKKKMDLPFLKKLKIRQNLKCTFIQSNFKQNQTKVNKFFKKNKTFFIKSNFIVLPIYS
jgi:hypothetical protein